MSNERTRVVCFVDGFNVYHALDDDRQYHKYKWLDYSKLAKCFLTGRESLQEVRYYSALVSWDAQKVERHRKYIMALETRDVEVILGGFRRKERKCRLCHQVFWTFEEKETDVNIAVDLIRLAYTDGFNKALLITGDSDIAPAIKTVQRAFPDKVISVVIPIARRAEHLKGLVSSHHKMKAKHLRTSQFPDVIDLGRGVRISRPRYWR